MRMDGTIVDFFRDGLFTMKDLECSWRKPDSVYQQLSNKIWKSATPKTSLRLYTWIKYNRRGLKDKICAAIPEE